jgi:hypothetical protein
MAEKKKSITDEVENTMACSAFAEADEPCPLDTDATQSSKKKEASMSVEDTMACSAFAEADEPCPLDTDKKKN